MKANQKLWHADKLDFSMLPKRNSRIITDKSQKLASTWFAMFLLAVLPIVFFYIFANGALTLEQTELIIAGDVVLAFVVVILYYATDRRVKNIENFAAENGFTFSSDVPDKLVDMSASMLFDPHSDTAMCENMLSNSNDMNPTFRMFEYSFETGWRGTDYTKQWNFVVAQIKLNHAVPHIVCDSRSNNFFGSSDLPDMFKSFQKIVPEGDFYRYFSTYVPQNFSRDSLAILTPDVMQAMLQFGKEYDFEFVDTNAFIYRQGDLYDGRDNVRDMMQLIETMSGEVTHQVEHYSAIANNSDKVLETIPFEGRHLRKRIPGDMWVYLFAALYFLIGMPIVAGIAMELPYQQSEQVRAILSWVSVGLFLVVLLSISRRVLR